MSLVEIAFTEEAAENVRVVNGKKGWLNAYKRRKAMRDARRAAARSIVKLDRGEPRPGNREGVGLIRVDLADDATR